MDVLNYIENLSERNIVHPGPIIISIYLFKWRLILKRA